MTTQEVFSVESGGLHITICKSYEKFDISAFGDAQHWIGSKSLKSLKSVENLKEYISSKLTVIKSARYIAISLPIPDSCNFESIFLTKLEHTGLKNLHSQIVKQNAIIQEMKFKNDYLYGQLSEYNSKLQDLNTKFDKGMRKLNYLIKHESGTTTLDANEESADSLAEIRAVVHKHSNLIIDLGSAIDEIIPECEEIIQEAIEGVKEDFRNY